MHTRQKRLPALLGGIAIGLVVGYLSGQADVLGVRIEDGVNSVLGRLRKKTDTAPDADGAPAATAD